MENRIRQDQCGISMKLWEIKPRTSADIASEYNANKKNLIFGKTYQNQKMQIV